MKHYWWWLASTLLIIATNVPTIRAQSTPTFARLASDGGDVAVAVDVSGRTHTVWTTVRNGQGSGVAETTVSNGQASSIRSIPVAVGRPVDGIGHQLKLVVSNDTLHLAVINDAKEVCYLRRAITADSWSTPLCVGGGANELSMAVLADQTIALAWSNGRINVALRRPDGTTQQVAIPDEKTAEREAIRPRLAATGNAFTVVWAQRRSDGLGNSYRSELLGRTFADGSWGSITSISGFQDEGQWQVSDAAIVGEPNGTLHIAYVLFAPGEDYRGPRYQLTYRRGRLDRLEAIVPLGGEGAEMPALSHRDGTIDLVWREIVGSPVDNLRVGNPEILWRRWRNGSWSSPRNISATAGNSQKPTSTVAPDGSGVVAWIDRTDVLLKQSTPDGNWMFNAPPSETLVADYVGRADRPVAMGAVARSWLWGPGMWAQRAERYAEAPASERTVFYYDKARIEVSDPHRPLADPGYFTNGLLVTEMAGGRVQYGDQLFIGRDPAMIAVAGDTINPNAPTYASFRTLVYIPEIGQRAQSADRTGQQVDQAIDRGGQVSNRTVGNIAYAHFVAETSHNIAAPFWTFLNQRGPVYQNGRLEDDLVFPWVTTMGYPIAEPYWTRTLVGGIERDVLVQLFQRRALTYTPSNPAGFQVEMGNVGQHYYIWRYGETPWVAP